MPKTPAYDGFAEPARAYLKEWREHYGLTQEELGERMSGTAKGRVSLKENRKEGWDDAYLGAVAKALGLHPLDLLVPPQESVSAAIRRIPGLDDEQIMIVEGVVADLLGDGQAGSEQSPADDPPSTSKNPRARGTSRSRAD